MKHSLLLSGLTYTCHLMDMPSNPHQCISLSQKKNYIKKKERERENLHVYVDTNGIEKKRRLFGDVDICRQQLVFINGATNCVG